MNIAVQCSQAAEAVMGQHIDIIAIYQWHRYHRAFLGPTAVGVKLPPHRVWPSQLCVLPIHASVRACIPTISQSIHAYMSPEHWNTIPWKLLDWFLRNCIDSNTFWVRDEGFRLEVDRISASVSAPNVDKWALSADIRFRPKAIIPHSVHFRFRRAAVDKFGGCRK